jgi:hypothetical protein
MPQEHSPEQRETISRFEKLLAGLALRGVDFAVVGGLAVILNGYPRVTLDADIIVEDSGRNIEKLLGVLKDWGEGWARELKPEDFQPQEGSIRVTEDFDLDIFTRMRGRTFGDFRPRFRYIKSGDASIPYIAPEDLLFLKQGSWREKDQMDALAMKKIIASEGK